MYRIFGRVKQAIERGAVSAATKEDEVGPLPLLWVISAAPRQPTMEQEWKEKRRTDRPKVKSVSFWLSRQQAKDSLLPWLKSEGVRAGEGFFAWVGVEANDSSPSSRLTPQPSSRRLVTRKELTSGLEVVKRTAAGRSRGEKITSPEQLIGELRKDAETVSRMCPLGKDLYDVDAVLEVLKLRGHQAEWIGSSPPTTDRR